MAGIEQLRADYRDGLLTRRGFLVKAAALGVSASAATALLDAEAEAASQPGSPAGDIWQAVRSGAWEVVDLSLTTAEDYPVNWPTDRQFTIIPVTWFRPLPGPNGRNGAVEEAVYATQRYELNEHTGTQIDFPPHFIPPPGVDVEGAQGNWWGTRTGDKYPLDKMIGFAVVVDVRALLEANTRDGFSAHITADWLRRWEHRHGRLRAGDVPLWFSGYSDRYFRRFPDNDRFADRFLWKPVVEKSAPGWAAADPDTMELLHDRGVVHVVTDGPSFGWTENGQPTHVAGLKYGMTWTEGATNLGSLPLRGALYVFAPYKVRDQQAGIGRAFAFSPSGTQGVGESEPLHWDRIFSTV